MEKSNRSIHVKAHLQKLCRTDLNCGMAPHTWRLMCKKYTIRNYVKLISNRTDVAVPSRPLRSHRSSTYCRKRAVSHRQTHGRMSSHRSFGMGDLRNLTCGPRPQSAARSMPCKIPWPARSATVPLSRCTQRDAKERPRPALRARFCIIGTS